MFGSKPPTAIVMMNMGGPSTQEEVCVPNTQLEIASYHIYIHAHTLGTYALAYTKTSSFLKQVFTAEQKSEKWRAGKMEGNTYVVPIFTHANTHSQEQVTGFLGVLFLSFW